MWSLDTLRVNRPTCTLVGLIGDGLRFFLFGDSEALRLGLLRGLLSLEDDRLELELPDCDELLRELPLLLELLSLDDERDRLLEPDELLLSESLSLLDEESFLCLSRPLSPPLFFRSRLLL